MTVSTATGYITSENGLQSHPVTLIRNADTGYFLLKPLLPLLKQLDEDKQSVDVEELRQDTETLSQYEDPDTLANMLSRLRLLVDTDENDEKWITGEMAHNVLRRLNILFLFENQFDETSDDSGNKTPKDEDITQNESVLDDLKKEDSTATSMTTTHLEEKTGQSEVNNNENDNTHRQSGNDGNANDPSTQNRHTLEDERSSSIKRTTNGDDDISLDSHRELGSPLKKLKFDAASSLKTTLDNLGEQKPVTDTKPTPMTSSDDDDIKPIAIFDHDLKLNNEILKTPLQLNKTVKFDDNADNNQRIKLETFLQKLLFPEAQNAENSKESDNPSTTTFDALLKEVDDSFPNIDWNLNIPVDEHGNTPLHWLTSIANIGMVKELVKHGSDRLIGDNMGESALVKAVKSVNNYDSGTFEELLDYLYPCLILEDSMSRTILHHIIITSGMTGCSSAAKYYLDILMGWIVKQPSRPPKGNKEKDMILDNLTLTWVISAMLNAQDSNGDTCLNIAARLGNVSIVDALLEYGADPRIPNKSGLRPIDFGAGTSKLNSQEKVTDTTSEIKDEDMTNNDENKNLISGLKNIKKPDTDGLVNDIKTLLSAVSKDYEIEVKQHKEKLNILRTDLSEQREKLSTSRDELAKSKEIRDQYNLLKEQLKNIKDGIEVEERTFLEESKKLGISPEETSGIDWDSNEYDADEPFRVDFIYGLLEDKLNNKYNGDMDKLLQETNVDAVVQQIQENYDNNEDKINDMLPPTVLLNARIRAYKRNDKHLDDTLNAIKDKQSKLEAKFRRVLSLCLKIDEDKVDGMLDGLLQAISSEDPQDIDTDEMQDFLKKHAV
ncbi:similar to Saccharomyces cerevisiae YLR182W SWI6 Transcription cofactor, forms complexes with Swi4p and Mbp1p to regulate transcription at the G1/S transition [Maudiozyma barnettii]|uniref:Similar to Saccharomyces cerevisiae YLR182W SWI6 Transcription cofactor, forms complexes with Swi4p and Mbp1p to regulate transcription at the G1/S transition n=1 Tax=Maudiozyma barnettii TaxID=61262 RepID=A0A8H2VDK1_9SACH|nr:transcriptional regulator SWI6 [Kazachstania barnettii]CAB4253313.1 similar to Saccharomyces cerevisiae YLR182W SWI6 Transcription cofactor, forms complexes with Swi4p and Mbp1p to regulate transcription at the G1/S transition [Kazachstania barnettii]CAD1780818.1 similar to Saccharomyces cerevisiae YLR182W SWI6 Transcription cofactor, forms complexes with Swi4p and Mbp1p to regulate transcription at the G1/S transition [Kazachstania barnettii]